MWWYWYRITFDTVVPLAPVTLVTLQLWHYGDVMVQELTPLHQHQCAVVSQLPVSVDTLGHVAGTGQRVTCHRPRIW